MPPLKKHSKRSSWHMKSVWDFFSSTTLTVTLAALICIDAAWGSVVCIRNPEAFGALDQAILFPWLFTAGLKNLAVSLWIFILIFLIFLYALNTVACTLDRVYRIVKRGGAWQGFLPHIVHVGFLVALLGHLLGSAYGFRSPENLAVKGEPLVVPHSEGLALRLEDVSTVYSPAGELTSLKTTVTLLKDDEELLKDTIGMNDPLIHNGIAFYHLDHGNFPTGFILDVEGVSFRVSFGGSFRSPGGGGFTLGPLYRELLLQEIVSEGGERAFLRIDTPGAFVKLEGETIILRGYLSEPYAVLAINRDPGIWYVIAGSSILVFGMVLLLFTKGERGELVGPVPSATPAPSTPAQLRSGDTA